MDDRVRVMSELDGRLGVCRAIIQTLENMKTAGEQPERVESALQHYREQLKALEERYTTIAGKPPPVIVELNPAVLSAKAQ